MIGYNIANREDVEWSNSWYDDANLFNLERILMVGDSTLRELRGTMKEMSGKPVDFYGCSYSFRDPLFEKGLKCFLEGTPYDRYDCVYLQFGNHGRIGLNGRDWEDEDDRMYMEGYRTCVDILKEFSSNIIIIPAFYICKPWKHFNKLKLMLRIPDEYDEKENIIVRRRNQLIRNFAVTNGLEFRDLTSCMEKSHFVRKDHIHFQNSSKKFQIEYLITTNHE